MNRVFVSSRLRADTPELFEQNIERARRYCEWVVDQGSNPYAPHVFYTQFMDDNKPEHREKALQFCIEELKRSDQLWVFLTDDCIPSAGMEVEIEFALSHCMEVKYFYVHHSNQVSNHYGFSFIKPEATQHPTESPFTEVNPYHEKT